MIDAIGRVVMVSGASRGIGAAVAQCLYDKGYTLSIGARDVAAMSGMVLDWDPARVLVESYDAHNEAHAEHWVERTLKRFGKLDAVVNNAGQYRSFSIEHGDVSELDDLLAVNVKGPLLLLRHAMAHLRACGSGRVVNVASMSGKRVVGRHVGYSMSKFALMALTQQVRHDGWDDGIRATALCPGFVATDMASALTQRDAQTMTQPEDLAEMVALVIALPNTSSVSEVLVQSIFEPMI